MKLIVGLGNPGQEYRNTRHNVGWLFLEYLEKKYNFSITKKQTNSLISKVKINEIDVMFAKPQTYMNLSGNAVLELKNYYNIDINDILIIFDDIDISFGSIRYRQKGSGGTHNGMKNIVAMLKNENIKRIKIGTGGLRKQNQDLADFVLEPFTKDEIIKLQEIFKETEQKMLEFIDN